MVHISRLAEDLIIYSSSEFSWVVCGDAYSSVTLEPFFSVVSEELTILSIF